MTIPPLSTLILSLVGGYALTAGWSDLRRFRIPNALPAVIVLLFPAYVLLTPASVAPLSAVLVGLMILVVGFLLYCLRMMGAGDVKLLAAGGLWAGADLGPEFIMMTAVCGGVVAAGLLTPWGPRLLAGIQTGQEMPTALTTFDARVKRQPMPYGVAIALAILFVVIRRVSSL